MVKSPNAQEDKMATELQAGDEIEFCLFDKKGKSHWYPGLIHGVKRYEEPSGVITAVSYLVDTGEDASRHEIVFDQRDREISKRVDKMLKAGEHPQKSLDKVLKHSDLPPSKLDVEVIRQPLQIELTESLVRKR